MDLEKYRVLRKRTEDPEQTMKEKLGNYALGLNGESGEVGDIIKKIVYHGHPITDEVLAKIEKELGDVAWYYFGLIDLLGLGVPDILHGNIEKLKERYPEGFSSEDSMNRDEEF